MRVKIIDGKIKIDNDAMNYQRVLEILKDGVKGESAVISGIDKAIKALQRTEYSSQANEAEDLKRNIKSIFTYMRRQISEIEM